MKAITSLMALVFVSHVGAQTTPSFADIELKLAANQRLPLGDRLQFELDTSKANSVSEALKYWGIESTVNQHNNTLVVTLEQQNRYPGVAEDWYSGDSFVIDIKEESTKVFTDGMPEVNIASFPLSKLENYVSDYIVDPTYEHGFNIASTVASQRSGDCTEYAVLTTALARSMSMPARLVTGTVIIGSKSGVTATGHAWTEVWRDGYWHIVDAALYLSEDRQRFYLPAAVLENEGPGFAFSLLSATALMPKKIINLRSL